MRSIEGKLTQEILDFIGGDPRTVASSNAFPIKTFRELVEKTAQLAYLNKDHLLFYRGQNSDYRNRGGSSTFYPSIYRGDYLQQREVNNRFDILNGACKSLTDLFVNQKVEGYKELKRKKYIQWSVLQHYEVCATPLLDFTHSLRVACSFALQDNNSDNAYIFVFGLPYITNRISVNSEHDLVNIRLLSICPPHALRPYFQEGYLVGTEDITTTYDSKSELDFNNRLIAKFEIPNSDDFWGESFDQIPKDSLYPDNDPIWELTKEIKDLADRELKAGDLGEFLKLWSELEETVVNKVKRRTDRFMSVREAIRLLYDQGQITKELLYEIDRLRKFRNQLVHTPKKVKPGMVQEFIVELERLNEEIKTTANNGYK
ncbi:FRG domain-containing protein [Maribacter litoralis]|uniref:FRG domain-containing protein n=1 Tax=Maribacter litoralis TaxID=2059726 RepID=UPI000E319457|nr:FRG domain-containing protein [Maribacter litoralis]